MNDVVTEADQLTFYGDQARKDERIRRCEAHIEADRLRAGSYGEIEENGKFIACAIGCQVYDIERERGIDPLTLNKEEHDMHELVANDYGWPLWLCYLEDTIFEGLPNAMRKGWPLRLVRAVPVGVDITPVRHRLLAFVAREIVVFDASRFPAVAAVNARVAELHDRAARGDAPTLNEWSAAWSAADSAAQSAAWSAAQSAAWSAAESASWSAADSAAYVRIADKLIELLEAA